MPRNLVFLESCQTSSVTKTTYFVSKQQSIEKMMDSYQGMLGSPPSTRVFSPLKANEHPELDESELLDAKGIQQYQSLIGMLQWAISIGCFDIQTAVMTLSSIRACPR